MSDYGLNFGFRRDEPSVKEGRQKVPATGDFYIGDLVTHDTENPGFVKKAPENARFEGGYTGLLIQEEGWQTSYFGAEVVDSFGRGKALNGKPTAIYTGQGLKIWLKNTEGATRRDGRTVTGRTVVDTTGLTAGDLLKWDGSKWVKTTTDSQGALRVTIVDAAKGYAEAVVR